VIIRTTEQFIVKRYLWTQNCKLHELAQDTQVDDKFLQQEPSKKSYNDFLLFILRKLLIKIEIF